MIAAREDVIRALAQVVGVERATEVVASTMAKLGARAWDEPTASKVIDELVAAGGTVALAARRLRMAGGRMTATQPTQARVADVTRALVELLTPSLGVDKATSVVSEEKARRGLATLSPESALSLLEALAQQGGAVGTVARFAKARAHLALANAR
jgi:hypothetical protein